MLSRGERKGGRGLRKGGQRGVAEKQRAFEFGEFPWQFITSSARVHSVAGSVSPLLPACRRHAPFTLARHCQGWGCGGEGAGGDDWLLWGVSLGCAMGWLPTGRSTTSHRERTS